MRLILSILLLIAPAIYAAETPVDCKNAMTQMAMNICAGQDFQRSDAQLNQVYKQKMATLGTEQQKKFKRAQRSWIVFRDSDCDFQSSGVEGGSIQPMIHAQCLQAKTEQRTQQINKMLHCEEGDLSCP